MDIKILIGFASVEVAFYQWAEQLISHAGLNYLHYDSWNDCASYITFLDMHAKVSMNL